MTGDADRTRIPAVLPYALGLFMLVPYMLWIGLWLFAFPGEKNGFEAAAGSVLFATSVPLVLWFALCSLGFIANSMAGASEFSRPRGSTAATIIAVLPAATLCIGTAGALYLLSLAQPWYVIAAPIAVGLIIAAAIRSGEAARTADGRAAGSRHALQAAEWPLATAETPLPTARRPLAWAAFALGALVLAALVVWSGAPS